MKIQEYIEFHDKLLDKYITDVQSGKQVTGRLEALAVDRYLKDLKRKDLAFSTKAYHKALTNLSFMNINIAGKYRQFILSPWQVFIIANLFGWYYSKTTLRRFRYGLITVGRKNGKTAMSVCIMILLLLEEQDAECYLLANSREQAGQQLRYAKAIVQHSPALDKRLKLMQYQLWYGKKNGLLKTLQSKSDRLDSLNVSAAIMDELHASPNLDAYEAIKSGTLARENPMVLITSTAGFRKDYPYYGMLETGKNILEGRIDDDSYFYYIATLDEQDDPADSKNWAKANPNMGVTINPHALQVEWQQAQNRSVERRNFYTKHLNLFTDSVDQFIDEEYLLASKKTVIEKELEGKLCFAGIDLASTTDFSAMILLFDMGDGTFRVIPRFWATQKTEMERKGGVNLRHWIKAGYCTQSDTMTTDFDMIFAEIADLSEKYQIARLDYDPFNSALLVPKLQGELGIYCEPFIQSAKDYNQAIKFMQKLFYEKKITLGKNELMQFCMRNIVIYQDYNDNWKIIKNKDKTQDSVDGAVSLAMALGGYIKTIWSPERVALENYNATQEQKDIAKSF